MTNEKIMIMISIIVYLAAVILVGLKYSKKTSTSGDFYLGGRKLGPFVTAMSAEASDMSSWLLMGLPGVAYISGLADAFWTAAGLAVGTYVNWLIVAKRIRVYSHKIGAITIPDFFANRFHDKSNTLMFISALFIIVFFIPYTASGFAACGKLFRSLFGIDYHMAMIISAVVILGYTALGGFLAASTTDFIQSIIMTVALVIVLVFGIASAGGIDAVIENAGSLPGYLGLTTTYNWTENASSPYGLITIFSMFAWGLGYFGMPHILLRFMAIEDERKIKTSRRVASVWVVVSLAVAVFIGIIGYSMSKAGVIPLLDGSAGFDCETIIIQIADKISSFGIAAAIISGVILAGILASTMSTSDSQLLAASSSVSENIIRGVFKIKMTEKTGLIVARISIIIISFIGVAIAWDENSSVFQIVSFAWAGFGAAFGPVILVSLFWRRMNRNGAVAGMIAGGIMIFIWKFVIRPMGGLFDVYELLPAFIVAVAFIFVVSLLTSAPDKKITDEFDEVMDTVKTTRIFVSQKSS